MKEKIKIIENNQEIEYDLYKICHNDEFDKNYIIYTNGNDYYASAYSIYNKKVIFDGINSDLEWDYIDKELNNE